MKKRFANAFLAIAAVLLCAMPALAARNELTPLACPSLVSGAFTANAADFTFVGSNSSGGYKFLSTGREVVLVWNTHATDPFTATVTSVAIDGRTTLAAAAYTLQAGDKACLGLIPVNGWRQTDGYVYLEASDDTVKYAILRLP